MKLGICDGWSAAGYAFERANPYADEITFHARDAETAEAIAMVLGMLAQDAARAERTSTALDSLAVTWGQP